MKYLALDVALIETGPQMLVWTSSKGLDARESERWVGNLCLLASWQEEQIVEQTVSLFFPQETLQLCITRVTMLMVVWPSLWCHNSTLLSTRHKLWEWKAEELLTPT
jgi:hypothetical protein